MSVIPQDTILRLAALSKLELTLEEIELFGRELVAIISFVDQLKNADVAGVEPTEQVTGLKNVVRADTAAPGLALSSELLARNARLEREQFKVPKVNL